MTSDIRLRSGNVFGANDGVEFLGGTTNTLKNYASISGGSFAVQGGTGNETIDNFGIITGNVDLGTGTNAFNNRAGGLFNAGTNVDLGGGTLTNSGLLSPGGPAAIQTTLLTGNLVQTSSGELLVHVDFVTSTSDKMQITGTANLAGNVTIDHITPHPTSGPSQQFTILTAAGGVDPNTQSTLGITPHPGLIMQLSYPDANDIVLGVLTDFAFTPGLNPNQLAVANYFNSLLDAGGSPALDPLMGALLNISDPKAYAAALDRLQPEHYLAQVEDTLQSSQFFLNSIMSCPTATGDHAFIAEDQCYWAKVGGRNFDWDRTWTNIGGDAVAWNVSGGVQVALQDNWRLGAAFSYEKTDIHTNNASTSDGDRVEGGLVLKNRWGDTSLAAAMFGGNGWFDTTRYIGLDGIGSAKGEQDIAFGGVNVRLSQLFDQGDWYVKPLVDLNATYVDFGGFQEHGGGVASLIVKGEQDWVLSASPALEIGAEVQGENGTILRPFVRAGATVFDDNNFALTSSFLGAPAGVAPFTVTSNFDEVFLDLSAGLDVLSLEGLEVKFNYDGRFSESSEMHSGGVKVGIKF